MMTLPVDPGDYDGADALIYASPDLELRFWRPEWLIATNDELVVAAARVFGHNEPPQDVQIPRQACEVDAGRPQGHQDVTLAVYRRLDRFWSNFLARHHGVDSVLDSITEHLNSHLRVPVPDWIDRIDKSLPYQYSPPEPDYRVLEPTWLGSFL